MAKLLKNIIKTLPTALAGLALGIASLGLLWETVSPMGGYCQIGTAATASLLLLSLIIKFILHPHILWGELRDPTVGSILPTFTMAAMVISKALYDHSFTFEGQSLWLSAVILHMLLLVIFAFHRLKQFTWDHMLPSWFVPPVGIIVAAVCLPSPAMQSFANLLLMFGLLSYGLLLPLMMYRLIFCNEIHDNNKPTIAILAAPASLSLAGYLTVIHNPSLLLVVILFGVALLMTLTIYIAFFKLLCLPFSFGYAAFTFPMVIGATALFKTVHLMKSLNVAQTYQHQVSTIAHIELMVATLIVSYVAVRYALRGIKELRHTIGHIIYDVKI